MNKLEPLWEGRSQKCHFLKEDIGGILVSMFSLGLMLIIFETWRGTISEIVMFVFVVSIIFYEIIGKFVFRFLYSRHTYYQIYDDRIVIIFNIMNLKYVREFSVDDISSIKMVKYKSGTGSIHFGDAETKYWNQWNDRYEGETGTAIITTEGLLRKNDKWHSGILYSIENVEQVNKILQMLINER